MLYISMNKGDYVTINGNIFVGYASKDGRNAFKVSIAAPKDIDITRGTFYEKELLKLAQEGNAEAAELLARLEIEHDERIEKSRARQAKLKAARFKAHVGREPERHEHHEHQWNILKPSESIENEVKIKSTRMKRPAAYVSP